MNLIFISDWDELDLNVHDARQTTRRGNNFITLIRSIQEQYYFEITLYQLTSVLFNYSFANALFRRNTRGPEMNNGLEGLVFLRDLAGLILML